MRIHNLRGMAGLLLCTAVLTGCGVAKLPDTVEHTSLSIDKTGAITSYTVGVFDKEYYDLEELQTMGREEVAAYNTEHQTGDAVPLTLEQVAELPGEDGSVMVSYRYDSAETYRNYHERALFYGTVEQAVEAGYDFDGLNQVLFDTKGDKSIVSKDLEESGMAKKHVILLEEQTRVYCPYKVAYISENAEVLEDGSIDTAGIFETEYPVIIVLDK